MSDTEHGAMEIPPEMEWEDAPDTEKAWRLAVAKEKTELSRRKIVNKVMVMDMVKEMVSMVESTSVQSFQKLVSSVSWILRNIFKNHQFEEHFEQIHAFFVVAFCRILNKINKLFLDKFFLLSCVPVPYFLT